VNIILFGPPGAGKGTHSNNIVNKFNYFQISVGDLLRSEIKKNNEIGKKIFSLISKGEFVSDEIINSILVNFISKPELKNKIIFDGYPRNLNQAEYLEIILKKNKQEIGFIIYLNVSREIIEKRILGRLICEKCNKILNEFTNQKELQNHACGKEFLKKRHDDNSETIIKRYETYMKETNPILKLYSNRPNFFDIDASVQIDEITTKIEEILKV
jgi:adenylate kinase